MNKTKLVVLKTSEPLFWEGQRLDLNQVYRCLEPVESGDDHKYMIYAEWFTQEEFETYFEYAHDRIMRDWMSFGLINEAHKLITFKEFKERMDMHTYGKQINNLRIGFIGKNKENFYKFYPMVDANKQIQLREMYEMCKYVIDGDTFYLDGHWIQFGTFGAYASYVRRK